MSRQSDMSVDQPNDQSTVRLPRVAVVGRPNVGKSTLVNRILGRRAAITQEVPGVTRDRVASQAERAMADADLLLFVVDATVGVTEEDAAVAARLRRGKVPVLLVANKVDGPEQELATGALWSLGLGE